MTLQRKRGDWPEIKATADLENFHLTADLPPECVLWAPFLACSLLFAGTGGESPPPGRKRAYVNTPRSIAPRLPGHSAARNCPPLPRPPCNQCKHCAGVLHPVCPCYYQLVPSCNQQARATARAALLALFALRRHIGCVSQLYGRGRALCGGMPVFPAVHARGGLPPAPTRL